MTKHSEKRLYRMLKAALECSPNFDTYEDEGETYKRFIIDLDPGFLFGYSNNAKIVHSKLGLLFRSENECRCLEPELKKVFNQIVNG